MGGTYTIEVNRVKTIQMALTETLPSQAGRAPGRWSCAHLANSVFIMSGPDVVGMNTSAFHVVNGWSRDRRYPSDHRRRHRPSW